MLSSIRRRLARAKSVLAYHEGTPAADTAATVMFDQLKTLYQSGLAQVGLRTDRENEARQLTARARDIRLHLQTGLLRLFVEAGRAAAREVPALAADFVRVTYRAPAVTFSTSARLLIDATRSHVEPLGPFGVTAELIAEAETLLAEFEEVSARAGTARNARIGARAELEVVTAAIMEQLGRLDGLLRHRLTGRSADLAAWKSALAASGPIHPRARTGAAEPPAAGPEPGLSAA
ncbi:MAG: hypothetical protein AB7L66_18585 [Gemmatimonadales bacterium]